MMIGYCIFCSDNDSYAFRDYPELAENQKVHQEIVPDMSGDSRPGLKRCKACNNLLDKWNESLCGLVAKKRKLDISCTYDGVVLVSKQFKVAYESSSLLGLRFQSLPDDPDFFGIQAGKKVVFDAERRKTRFIKPCQHCGHHESVVGATPVFLKPDAAIGSNEFVRTDLEFGSDDEKSPLLLCGEFAAGVLRVAKLNGLEIERIER